jgi:predicted dehydrogenase
VRRGGTFLGSRHIDLPNDFAVRIDEPIGLIWSKRILASLRARTSRQALDYAALDISYTVPDSFPHGRDLYVSIRGTQGLVSWSPAYEGERDVLHVSSDHADFAGSPRREITFDLEPVAGYSGFMGAQYVRDFADAILTGRAPAVSGEDVVAALKVVEAIYRSATEGRWVSVSP